MVACCVMLCLCAMLCFRIDWSDMIQACDLPMLGLALPSDASTTLQTTSSQSSSSGDSITTGSAEATATTVPVPSSGSVKIVPLRSGGHAHSSQRGKMLQEAAKHARIGSRLGLPICFRLAKAMGGSVGVCEVCYTAASGIALQIIQHIASLR